MLSLSLPNRRLRHSVSLGVLALAVATSPTRALEQVHIALVGEIERRCTLYGAAATVDLGDVSTSGHRDLALRVSCNTPFQYSLRSSNGGLRHTGSVARIGKFTELLPYQVDVSVPTNIGHAAFTCASDEMTDDLGQCAAGDSGLGIALGKTAALTLSWQSPPFPMLAGRFEDALTISFSAKP